MGCFLVVSRFVQILRPVLLCGAFTSGLMVLSAVGEISDPAADAGRVFAPFVIRLREDTEMSPLPPWMQAETVITEELGAVEIPLPSIAAEPGAERYVVTVVFEDGGDGGPAVEWREGDGETVVLSEGLGEALDNRLLGLNAQTILLPEDLTREGGTLIVSYFGRFSSLDSVTVHPATESVVAVIGGRADPALVDKQLTAYSGEQTDGRRSPPLTGDVRDGAVIEAELAAEIEKLDEEIEFVVPVEGKIEGVMLLAETLGLDLEATVEVTLNGQPLGVLALAPFALDSPAVTEDLMGRLIVAGWREGSLFLPSRLWQAGENRLLLRLMRSAHESGYPVFLRNTGLHLRFGTEPESAATDEISSTEPVDETLSLTDISSGSMPDGAGTASSPEIDFRLAPTFIEAPRERGMPVVITTKQ